MYALLVMFDPLVPRTPVAAILAGFGVLACSPGPTILGMLEDASHGDVEEHGSGIPRKLCVGPESTVAPDEREPSIVPDVYSDDVSRSDFFGNSTWGGGYRSELTIQALENPEGAVETQFRGSLSAGVRVFGSEKDVAEAVVTGHNANGGEAELSADLIFLGKFVFPVIRETTTFYNARNYTLQVLEVTAPYAPEGTPINVELDFEVWGTLGYEGTGHVWPTSLSARFRPHANALVTGAIALVLGSHKGTVGRLEGNVELIDVGVPLTFGVDIGAPANGVVRVGWGASTALDAHWLSGNVKAKLEVDSDGFEQVLAKWDGYSASHEIASGKGVVQVQLREQECGELPYSTVSTQQLPERSQTDLATEDMTVDQLFLALEAAASGELRPRLSLVAELKHRVLADRSLAARAAPLLRGPAARDVIAALAAASTPESLAAVLDTAENAPDTETRLLAIGATGMAPRLSVEAAQRLHALLSATDGSLREAAAYAVGNAVDTLSRTQPELASSLVWSLGSHLAPGAGDSDNAAVFARALANTRHGGAIALLTNLAVDTSRRSNLRVAALDALGRATRERPLEVVRLADEDGDPSVRFAARVLGSSASGPISPAPLR